MLWPGWIDGGIYAMAWLDRWWNIRYGLAEHIFAVHLFNTIFFRISLVFVKIINDEPLGHQKAIRLNESQTTVHNFLHLHKENYVIGILNNKKRKLSTE